MSSPSVERPSLIAVLNAAIAAALAKGITVAPGSPSLCVRAGRWALGFPRRVDVLGAVLLNSPTKAQCFDFEASLEDASALLGVTPAAVHWIADGFDDVEDPPTEADGFDREVVEAFAAGQALRAKYLPEECGEPLN